MTSGFQAFVSPEERVRLIRAYSEAVFMLPTSRLLVELEQRAPATIVFNTRTGGVNRILPPEWEDLRIRLMGMHEDACRALQREIFGDTLTTDREG